MGSIPLQRSELDWVPCMFRGLGVLALQFLAALALLAVSLGAAVAALAGVKPPER